MYVTPIEAREILEDRRPLRREIERWWNSEGWYIPDQFCKNGNPLAGFGRSIATRRYEDALFAHYAKQAELTPRWLEYTAASFSSHSPFARSLLQPTFYERRGKNGGIVTERRKLACIQTARTMRISEITTRCGTQLVDYHHRLHARFGLDSSAIVDCSEFYGQFGGASKYYLPYLSLFIGHGVLFEDYHGGESGDMLLDFTDKIFLPAFQALETRFGVSPLLVRMPWDNNLRYYVPEDRTDWHDHGVVPDELLRLH